MAAPVVVIGLDALDHALALRFMAEGAMPALAGLVARGFHCPLASPADAFAAAVWPTFMTGVHPGKHGSCGGYAIRPGTYDVRRADPRADHEVRPFYAGQGAQDRVVILDMPKSQADLTAVSLIGWGAHAARSGPASSPPELFHEVVRDVGRYPLALLAQEDDVHTHAYYLELRRRLLEGVALRQKLHAHFLARPGWELLIAVMSEPHVAGHRFWHFMDERHAWHDAGAPVQLKSALRDVYAAVDAALADVVARLPPAATLLVVGSHGMCASPHGNELLARLLERMSGVDHRAPSKDRGRSVVSQGVVSQGVVARGALALRALAPPPLRAMLKQRVPALLRQRLRSEYLKAAFGAARWPRMRAFATPTEDNGYVRVNLRGREPAGIVMPGAPYEALLEELSAELLALTDIDSGEPVVASLLRPQQRYPGPKADKMPDLVVCWRAGSPVRGLRSARYGDIDEKARVPMHRSGDHHAGGFLVAVGPTVQQGAQQAPAQLVDLAPTILTLQGAALPDWLDGRALAAVAGRGA